MKNSAAAVRGVYQGDAGSFRPVSGMVGSVSLFRAAGIGRSGVGRLCGLPGVGLLAMAECDGEACTEVEVGTVYGDALCSEFCRRRYVVASGEYVDAFGADVDEGSQCLSDGRCRAVDGEMQP